ncbi:MAG: hypothetical protein V4603_00090 [Pseudomonadota bacterium]
MSSPATNKLQTLINALPRELAPARDLWPGIDHAINASSAVMGYRPYALAASVLLVLGLSVFYGVRQPLPSITDPGIEAYISDLQVEHQRSKEAILVEFRDQQPWYPEWEDQLHQLETAENAIYDALRNDPDNRELLSILRDVQNKQLKLIDAVFAPQRNSI